ncbi:hypothetical protein [Streptomyces microflavus]
MAYLAFLDAGTIAPVRISDSYYLAADGQVAAKPYTLLRQALERSSKVAWRSSPGTAANASAYSASARARSCCTP